MAEFYHKNCGSAVLVDLSGTLKVVASFGVGKTVLKLVGSSLIPTEDPQKAVPTTFYCTTCKRTVLMDEIVAYCNHCNEAQPLDKLYRMPDVGGVYCETCQTNNYSKYSGTKRLLSAIAAKITLVIGR